MVSEYLEQAGQGTHAYVIRAEPSGVPGGVGSLSIWIELLAQIRRLLTRERSWTVRVRRRDDDPFGAIIHEETVPDGIQARAKVQELKQQIESGRFPPIAS